jgi:putative NIF3 family GTP cyclohydrolase 1 type 2
MEPGLKTILEGHRGDIKVIAQALKAEVAFFLHWINLEVFWSNS